MGRRAARDQAGLYGFCSGWCFRGLPIYGLPFIVVFALSIRLLAEFL